MNKPYLQHAHIICRDLQGMIDFWVDVLGATFVEKRTFGAADGAVLTMNSVTEIYLKQLDCEPQDSTAPRTGFEHPGLVIEGLDALLDKVRTLPGCKVTKEPFMSGPRRCAFIAGPEGVLVEVMEDPK